MKDLRFAVKALSPVCGRWEDIGVAAGVQQLNVTKRKFGNSKLIDFCIIKKELLSRKSSCRHVA